MLNIAICDDNTIVCSQIEKILKDYNNDVKTDTSIFYSPDKFISALKNGTAFDLVFLDIEFPDSNGVEIGRVIREELKNESIQIVYISAKDSYVKQLFENRPLNFFEKPLKADKIISVLKKAERLKMSANEVYSFSFKNTTISLLYKDIIYFESERRKMRVFTAKESYGFNGTIKKLLENINKDNFLQIHKSIIANMDHVKEYRQDSLILTTGKSLPISRGYKKELRNKVLNKNISSLQER